MENIGVNKLILKQTITPQELINRAIINSGYNSQKQAFYGVDVKLEKSTLAQQMIKAMDTISYRVLDYDTPLKGDLTRKRSSISRRDHKCKLPNCTVLYTLSCLGLIRKKNGQTIVQTKSSSYWLIYLGIDNEHFSEPEYTYNLNPLGQQMPDFHVGHSAYRENVIRNKKDPNDSAYNATPGFSISNSINNLKFGSRKTPDFRLMKQHYECKVSSYEPAKFADSINKTLQSISSEIVKGATIDDAKYAGKYLKHLFAFDQNCDTMIEYENMDLGNNREVIIEFTGINKDLAIKNESIEMVFNEWNEDLIPIFYDQYFKTHMRCLYEIPDKLFYEWFKSSCGFQGHEATNYRKLINSKRQDKIDILEKQVYAFGYRQNEEDKDFDDVIGALQNHLVANNQFETGNISKVYDTLIEDIQSQKTDLGTVDKHLRTKKEEQRLIQEEIRLYELKKRGISKGLNQNVKTAKRFVTIDKSLIPTLEAQFKKQLEAIQKQLMQKWKDGQIKDEITLDKAFKFAIKDHLPHLNSKCPEEKFNKLTYEQEQNKKKLKSRKFVKKSVAKLYTDKHTLVIQKKIISENILTQPYNTDLFINVPKQSDILVSNTESLMSFPAIDSQQFNQRMDERISNKASENPEEKDGEKNTQIKETKAQTDNTRLSYGSGQNVEDAVAQ